ncbi:hypothetical protein LCGC14_2219200 [marine sediment metagenome]|uniref:Uncharacterized protein n=1 Tax=marine sediment metagenome TaxID=412755 RepID=A0A0F9FP13_9ZZZZ
MGYYINPPNETKEEWLNDNGIEVTVPEWDLLATNFPGGVYVCLVDNGLFTAVGIAYKESEFNEFNDTSHDDRPRKWYVVPHEDIINVCPDVEDRLEAGL